MERNSYFTMFVARTRERTSDLFARANENRCHGTNWNNAVGAELTRIAVDKFLRELPRCS